MIKGAICRAMKSLANPYAAKIISPGIVLFAHDSFNYLRARPWLSLSTRYIIFFRYNSPVGNGYPISFRSRSQVLVA